jgi:hypothetical protein
MQTTFWLMPVREVGIVVGAVVAFLLLLIVGVRGYVRRELRRAGHANSPAHDEDAHLSFARRLSRALIRLVILLVVAFIVLVIFLQ